MMSFIISPGIRVHTCWCVFSVRRTMCHIQYLCNCMCFCTNSSHHREVSYCTVTKSRSYFRGCSFLNIQSNNIRSLSYLLFSVVLTLLPHTSCLFPECFRWINDLTWLMWRSSVCAGSPAGSWERSSSISTDRWCCSWGDPTPWPASWPNSESECVCQ